LGSAGGMIINNPIETGHYRGRRTINFYDGSRLLVNISHNFSKSSPNLTNLTILINSSGNKNSLIVQGLNASETKTIYLSKNQTSSNAVCVLDAEVENLTYLHSTCQKISCPGSFGNITCEVENDTFAISGLSHSGAIEDYIEEDSGDDGGSGEAPGSGRGSGGGGNSRSNNNNQSSAVENITEEIDNDFGNESQEPIDTAADKNQNKDSQINKEDVLIVLVILIILGIIGAVVSMIMFYSRQRGKKRLKNIKKIVGGDKKEMGVPVKSNDDLALEKIVNYIKKTQKLGFNKEQIKNAIQKEGWKKELIDQAFKKNIK